MRKERDASLLPVCRPEQSFTLAALVLQTAAVENYVEINICLLSFS